MYFEGVVKKLPQQITTKLKKKICIAASVRENMFELRLHTVKVIALLGMGFLGSPVQ